MLSRFTDLGRCHAHTLSLVRGLTGCTRAIGILLLVGLVLSACGGGESETPTKTLSVYTTFEDDEIGTYLKMWGEAHPDIELHITRDSTGIMTAKLLAEKDNPQADVVVGLAASSLLLCDSYGMCEPYRPEGVERIDPRFRDMRNDPPHWVGIKAWMTGFVCNTIEMKKLGLPYPESYQDLTRPIYEGRIAMPNPASSGTGYLTVSAILQMMGEEKGWDYLDRLHKNVARYTHSGSLPAKLAGRGEFPIGISFGYRGVRQKMKGEPVRTVFPKEGSGWDVEANALIRKDNIKPEARLFLDWAISEPLMRAYMRYFPVIAMQDIEVPEIDADFPKDPRGQLIENDLEWMALNRKRILEEWSSRYDGKSDPRP